MNATDRVVDALLSLSRTQRQLAHRARQEAKQAELGGHVRSAVYWHMETRRLWREARRNFGWARRELGRAR